MSTPRQRQQQREEHADRCSCPRCGQRKREEQSIDSIIARMRQREATAKRMDGLDALYGDGYSHRQVIKAEAARQRLRAPLPPATQAQLAIVARQLETIIAAETVNPETGEISIIEQTKRAISLVDMMQKGDLLPMDLHQAADRYRELFFKALGSSKGVSSYGGYIPASEPSKRLALGEEQENAYAELKQASVAAFGTVRQDKRWALDEQLMTLVVPAILSDKKEISQEVIGTQRTRYKGSAQVRAAGGVVVYEVLQKLSLHFQYRER